MNDISFCRRNNSTRENTSNGSPTGWPKLAFLHVTVVKYESQCNEEKKTIKPLEAENLLETSADCCMTIKRRIAVSQIKVIDLLMRCKSQTRMTSVHYICSECLPNALNTFESDTLGRLGAVTIGALIQPPKRLHQKQISYISITL